MANNQQQLAAAKACNSDTDNARPGAAQDCSDVLNISIFFDGTGNNKDADEPLLRWSNPTRLWRAAQMQSGPERNNFVFYIAGVGTKYNGTSTTNWGKADAFVEDKALGMGFGAGGTRRTNLGQNNVNAALRKALMQNASRLNAVTKAYAEKATDAKLSDISRTLAPYRLIRVINLSVFGFSRGAALARAFVNEFLKQCKIIDEKNIEFNHHPVNIRFLGLFDTVASFGLPAINADNPFDEKNLVVPDVVQRCVHYVAAHELRFSFPVDLIRKKGQYRPNWTEKTYPGVHSDVGGGYEPNVQMISNNYARIPMRDMMNEAVGSGVRMLAYDGIAKNRPTMFKEQYQILPLTEQRYKAYMAAVNANGTMEQCVTAHMKALYSAFGTMTRRKIKTPDLVEAEGSTAHALVGHMGIAKEAELLLDPAKARKDLREKALYDSGLQLVQVAGSVYVQIVRPEAWRLEAWKATAPEPVVEFVRYSVHDSKAGFLASVEPFSYFRPRGMAESSRNVLARGMDWLDDRATELKHGTIKVYHKAERVVVETWEEGVLVATRTYRVGEKFVVDTARAGIKYSFELYQSGERVLISTMKRGEQMVITSIDTVKKEASALANAAEKKAGELGRQIQSGASQAAENAGQAVDNGLKAVEERWRAAQAAFGF